MSFSSLQLLYRFLQLLSYSNYLNTERKLYRKRYSLSCRCMKYAIALIGQWHMNSGSCKLFYLIRLEPNTSECHLLKSQAYDMWHSLITTLRKKDKRRMSPYFMVTSLSNKTVFTGIVNRNIIFDRVYAVR